MIHQEIIMSHWLGRGIDQNSAYVDVSYFTVFWEENRTRIAKTKQNISVINHEAIVPYWLGI